MDERKSASFKRKSKTRKKPAIRRASLWHSHRESRQGKSPVLNRICACILAFVLVFTLWPVTTLDAIARTNTEIDTVIEKDSNTDTGTNLDVNTDPETNSDVNTDTSTNSNLNTDPETNSDVNTDTSTNSNLNTDPGTNADTNTATATANANTKATGISNPRTGDIVTWDCVYFGSYPQSEVTSADGGIYNTLQNATGWNANGDLAVAGTKYRRLKKSDATFSEWSGDSGSYNWSDSITYHYFKYEPIKWRVLNVSGGQAFLLADVALDDQRYNTSYTGVTWKTSTVRSWMNGYGSTANAEGTDYSGKNFINSAFSSSEQGAIANTNVVNANNINYGTAGGENTTDKVFLLSESEVYNTDAAASYGFAKDRNSDDPARRSKCSAYSFAMGTYKSYGEEDAGYDAGYNDNCWWWLRSPDSDINTAAYVYYNGWVRSWGDAVYIGSYGIRPALKLNLSSTNLYSYAGTVTSEGSGDQGGGTGEDETGGDDTITQPTYKDVNKVDTGVTDENAQLNLLSGGSGNAKGSKLVDFLPGDYQLSFPAVNTKFTKETNGDGTYTVKMSMGTKDNMMLNSEKSWKKYKDDIQDGKENASKVTSIVNKYSDKKSFTITKELKALPEVDIVGFYEYVCDENGKVLSNDGGMLLQLKWEASKTRQCVTAPIPIPYYIELGGSLTAEATAKISSSSKKNKAPSLSGTVKATIDFNVGAGFGVSGVATLGVEGGGELEAQILPATKGDLSGSFKVKAKILFVFDGEYTVAKTPKLTLWDTTKKTAGTNAQESPQTESDFKITTVDRSYQANTSAWNGKPSKKNATLKADGDITSWALQESILPNTVPKMVKMGTDTVMVFQSNDAKRTAVNSVKLMYSVYDGNGWSEPKAFWDNGTLDSFANMKVINGDLYATWQKCDKIIGEGEAEVQMAQVAAASEICVSRYNKTTHTFEQPQQITDNDTFDTMPTLAGSESGTVEVVWVNNESTDVTQSYEKKNFMKSVCEAGKWSQGVLVDSTSDYITELAALSNAGSEYIVYSGVSEEEETGLYVLKDGQQSMITSSADSTISNLSGQGTTISYTKDGILFQYQPEQGLTTEITCADGSSLGANGVKYDNGSKEAVLWMTNDEQGCGIYSSIKTAEGYSAPVNVYKNDAISGNYITAALDEDGKWQIILSGTSLTDENKTDLFFINKGTAPKVEIDSVLVNEDDREGEKQPVSYTVVNQGEETLKEFELTVTDENGELESKTVSCNIAPGEAAYLEDTYRVDSTAGTQTVNVNVEADGQKDLTNVTTQTDVNYADLEIAQVKKTIKADAVSFAVTVRNNGKAAIGGNLAFYGDKEGTNQIASQEIGTLAVGEEKEIIFDYANDDITFDSEGTSGCLIKATSPSAENSLGNNEYPGIVYDWELAGSNKNVGNLSAQLSQDVYQYTGRACEPTVTVEGLTKGEDYEVTYQNNVNAGTAEAIVTGLGDYHSTKTLTYTIEKAGTAIKANDTYVKTVGNPPFNLGASVPGNGNLTYQSADSAIAAVDGSGNVTIKKAGETTIQITAAESENYTAASKTVTITVKEASTLPGANTNTGANTSPGSNRNPGASSNSELAIGTIIKLGFDYFTVTGNRTVTFSTTTNKKVKSTFIPSVVSCGGRTYDVTAIKANAFKNCKKLKKLTIKSTTIKSIGKNALKGTGKNLVIKVPASKRNAYKKLFKNKGNRTITVK